MHDEAYPQQIMKAEAIRPARSKTDAHTRAYPIVLGWHGRTPKP